MRNTKIIDSRDIIEKAEEARQEIDEAEEVYEEAEAAAEAAAKAAAEAEEAGSVADAADVEAAEAAADAARESYKAAKVAAAEAKDALDRLREEHRDLIAFCEEGERSVPEWRYGETLIRKDYFEEYAEELAEAIGAIDRNARWPMCHIDWTAAAEALKQDYWEIEYEGETYLYRNC